MSRQVFWFGLAVVLIGAPLHAQSPAPATANFPLSGDYEILTHRRASTVSAPADLGPQAAPGTVVSFGPTLHWIDGRVCRQWAATPFKGIPFDLHDRNLSDMMIGPIDRRPERRLNSLFRLTCDGAELAWLLAVDQRVAIVPGANGASFAVLAQRPSPELVRRLQDGLRKQQLYNGVSSGIMDEATQAALANYAERRGAGYRFMPVAPTANLLDGLGVLD